MFTNIVQRYCNAGQILIWESSHSDTPPPDTILSLIGLGVALSPGSGEFALATQPVRRILGEGITASENINNTRGVPDFTAVLDQLEDSAPNVDSAQKLEKKHLRQKCDVLLSIAHWAASHIVHSWSSADPHY